MKSYVAMKVKSFSRVQLFETTWTVAYQAPPSMGFSRQEYWSGVPLPSLVESLALYNFSRRSDSIHSPEPLGVGVVYQISK